MSTGPLVTPRAAPVPIPTPTATLLSRPLPLVLIASALCLVLSWQRLGAIWSANTFFDTDDAMRLVEVRDWLAGQGWFDLVAHRLHPPAGLLMHWSRVVDVPVGALIRLFALFTSPDCAERLARIVFPLLLQVGLIAVVVALIQMLMGTAAMLPGAVMLVFTGFMFEQFPPGRIDHHAPQIVLLMGMTGCLLSSLSPRHAWHAALAGLCVALSLAISLENLPFIAVAMAVLPTAWLRAPSACRAPMLWLAASLAAMVPACFLATVPPSRYGDVVGDALSLGHVTAALVGAAGLAVLGLRSTARASPVRRIMAMAGVGAVLVALLVIVFPVCLHGPYAGMDPLLKRLWLDHVTEAQPLLSAARQRPDTFTMLFCPMLLGAVGTIVAAWAERGVARVRWLAVLALTLVGLAGTLWEIRVAASVQPLAMLGGVWVVMRLIAATQRRGASAAIQALATLALLPFTTLAWAFVPVGEGDQTTAAAVAQGQACRTAAALAPLASLPPGLVFAPIDDGAYVLVATPHAVVAAPYHRNGAGNRAVLMALLAPPDTAEAMVRVTGARYLAFCPDEVGMATVARAAPDGLGASLAGGHVPAWLTPVPLAATPYRVFALRQP